MYPRNELCSRIPSAPRALWLRSCVGLIDIAARRAWITRGLAVSDDDRREKEEDATNCNRRTRWER